MADWCCGPSCGCDYDEAVVLQLTLGGYLMLGGAILIGTPFAPLGVVYAAAGIALIFTQ